MKDLREATYISDIKIYIDRSKRLLGLSHSTYIENMLKRFSMDRSKNGFIPMTHGITFSKSLCPQKHNERTHMSLIPYASAIGSIIYSIICIRPDVSYTLSVTCRYKSDLSEGHWVVVKNILKYLRNTKDIFLIYGDGDSDLHLQGYMNDSFQSNKDDSESQSGYVFILNGGVVGWKKSK